MPVRSPPSGSARLADLLVPLSLAMDLGLGQPQEHVLRTVLRAMRLARAAGLSDGELETVYYTTFLRFLGCTADGHGPGRIAAADDPEFAASVAPFLMGLRGERGPLDLLSPAAVERTLCAHGEVATRLAARLDLPAGVPEALAHGYSRWDGSFSPDGRRGEAIPLAARIAILARDIDLLVRHHAGAALDELRRRRGVSYDPVLVDLAAAEWPHLTADPPSARLPTLVLEAEPAPRLAGPGDQERLAEIAADFADLTAPAFAGHSRGVAGAARAAARSAGLPDDEVRAIGLAGLLHDLGRVAVPRRIWECRKGLGPAHWVRIRHHPGWTAEWLRRSRAWSGLAALAGSHHERLDGSGYPGGLRAPAQGRLTRLLAAADVYQAAGEARPHRMAAVAGGRAALLRLEVRAGRLDRWAVDQVLAASAPAPAPPAPGQLTPRELEIAVRLCRGSRNAQVAAALGIAPGTVSYHAQNICAKLGVRSRAALVVAAAELGLLSA